MKNLLLLLTFTFLLLTCSFAQTGIIQLPNDGTLKWSIGSVGPGTFTDNPQFASIGPDGTVYVNTEQSYLVAINPSDGTELWDLSGHYFPPSIGADGTLYSGSATDLVAINPDGTEQWRLPLGLAVSTSPAQAADGTVYIGADHYLIAVDPVAQTELWRLATGAEIKNAPAVGYDGSVYVTSGNDLVAVNPETQSELWRFTADDPVTTSAALGAEGMIYVGANSQFYAINPGGTEKWKYKTGAFIGAAPAIGSDGTIYLPVSFIASGYSGYGLLIALHPDGYQKWRLGTDYYNRSTPTLGVDGNIYLATAGFEGLLAIDAYGNELWRYPAFGNANWSPPMATDGTIYFSSSLGTFTAVETASGGLADTPWPMDGHDTQHTGRNSEFTPSCPGPVITAEPENLLIEPDSTTTLTVTAEGDPPLSYQWYAGFVGDKSNPAGTGDSFTTPAMSESKSYWVEISNSCGFTFSRAVTVAVGIEGQMRWYFMANEAVTTSPAIAGDGTVYFGTESSTLYAVNPDGTEKWQFQAYHTPSAPNPGSIDNWILGSDPTIGPDGTIYFGSGGIYYPEGDQVVFGILWALNPDGSEKWRCLIEEAYYWPAPYSSPALGLDGTLYITDRKSSLNAINGDGTKKWRFDPSVEYAGTWSSPAIGMDGSIYFDIHWHDDLDYRMIYAMNPDGTVKWQHLLVDTVYAGSTTSPAIGADGTIYIPHTTYFLALKPDGTEKWRFHTGGRCKDAAIGADGTVYFGASTEIGSNYGHVYALNPATGEQLWKSDLLPYDVFDKGTAAAIGADGVIYIRMAGPVRALDPLDGSVKWVASTGPGEFSAPVISPDGTLYAGYGHATTNTDNGFLWSVITNSMGPADSHWSVSGQNNAHWQRDPNATINCEEPVITVQPQDQTIIQGEQATITVTATGTAPLFQWYKGNPGDMGTPADTGAVLITPPLTQNQSYWVRISNACGEEESQQVTVTVIPNSTSETGDDALAVSIVPNPTRDQFKVQSPEFKVEGATLELYDLNGRKLLEKTIPKGSEEVKMNVSSLQSGLYFCRISTEGNSVTKKLIIQK